MNFTIDKSMIILGDLNTPFSIIGRTIRESVSSTA
jgi:hypothetical protein